METAKSCARTRWKNLAAFGPFPSEVDRHSRNSKQSLMKLQVFTIGIGLRCAIAMRWPGCSVWCPPLLCVRKNLHLPRRALPWTRKRMTPARAADDPLTTMFPHAEWDRLWLSGQANFISQYHPTFHSPYQGPNSLSPEAQDATSRVLTLFTGLRLTDSTEFLCDVQETGGNGLGRALGVAGFFNLDVVRNPTLSKAPYIARLMWHQIIPLGSKKVVAERGPFSLFRELPERRLEVRFGKMSLVGLFRHQFLRHDSNFQFMNWTVDNNGAYDYAADTRGFTFAALVRISRPQLGRFVLPKR